MARLKKQSNGVNIKLAVANQGTVSFYGLFEVDLPTLVSFGWNSVMKMRYGLRTLESWFDSLRISIVASYRKLLYQSIYSG